MRVALDEARAAFDASVTAFVDDVVDLSEWELLGASRCHGWSRLEVVDHVLAGWQEMLSGFVTLVDDEPTVDAATYWTAFAQLNADFDPVELLLAQRRRAVAHRRPSSLAEQLRDVGDVMLAASARLERHCRWQGHVFAPGDFLAVWAVEGAVHHLDLLAGPAPAAALTLARATVDVLAPGVVPADWSDERAVLAGAGRIPGPPGLPVLG